MSLGYGNLVLSWPHRLTDKNSSFACSPPFRLRNDNYEVQRKWGLVKFTHYQFFPVFLFSSFVRVQISELRTPIHFQKKVLHVLSWETSTSTTAVFFFNVMQPSKICLSQGDAQLVNARSSICHIMFSRHCTLRISPPILGWTIVTPQGR